MHNIYRFRPMFQPGFHYYRLVCRRLPRNAENGEPSVSSDPYQAYPSFPAGAALQLIEEPAVQLIAAGPIRQRRLTVAFRLILVIPQLFVLFFLDLAGLVVAFLGWWAALFMGRLPDFAVNYLSGLARWNVRFYGYLFLLTDDYPPFNFDDDPAYPVVLAIPAAGRLNRFAVFFRFILVIWAWIVVTTVIGGAGTLMAFVAWLITLITGKLPAPLHLAFTAVLRYWTRYYCYTSLLTPTYPWKLFGDAPDAAATATATGTPAETVPPAEPTQWSETATPVESAWGTPPGYDTTPGYDTQPGYGATPGYGAPGGYPSAQPAAPSADWRLVLPRSAKILLIVFIVLGLANVGSEILSATSRMRHANSTHSLAVAISEWNSAQSTLNTEMTAWTTSINACDKSESLACAKAADAKAAGYLSAFASRVQAIAMPSGAASADAAKTIADATRASGDFTTISQDKTVAEYQADMASSGISPDLSDVQTDMSTLASALSASARS
jgi:hypothetical protein